MYAHDAICLQPLSSQTGQQKQSPDVGLLCADEGSNSPPVVCSSASATLQRTRSPLGLTCNKQSVCVGFCSHHRHQLGFRTTTTLALLNFFGNSIAATARVQCFMLYLVLSAGRWSKLPAPCNCVQGEGFSICCMFLLTVYGRKSCEVNTLQRCNGGTGCCTVHSAQFSKRSYGLRSRNRSRHSYSLVLSNSDRLCAGRGGEDSSKQLDMGALDWP